MAYDRWLMHHGVKGMKWGVRKDNKTFSLDRKKANDIYKSLSDKEKFYVTADHSVPKEYATKEDYKRGGYNKYSYIEQHKDTPVSVLDLWDNGDNRVNVSIAVRNDKRYRGKGYAQRAVDNGKKWLESHPEYTEMVWGVDASNIKSKKLAEKNGFEFVKRYTDWGSPDEAWDVYRYKNPNHKKE